MKSNISDEFLSRITSLRVFGVKEEGINVYSHLLSTIINKREGKMRDETIRQSI